MKRLGAPHPPAGQEVDVHVVHDLASLGAAVHPQPIPALGQSLGLTDRAGREKAAAEDLGILALHRHDRGDVALGYDEEMDRRDRKSTRLNSSHMSISYAVFCLKKKKKKKK